MESGARADSRGCLHSLVSEGDTDYYPASRTDPLGRRGKDTEQLVPLLLYSVLGSVIFQDWAQSLLESHFFRYIQISEVSILVVESLIV